MLLPSLILFAALLAVQSEEEFNKKGPAVIVKTEFKHTNKIIENARSYKELIENSDVFIDKSHFVATWHKHTSAKIYELRCAPRFGKSITLHMVKNFLEIELYKNWTRKPLQEASSYKLFRNKEIVYENDEKDTLIDDLNINSQDEVIMKSLGNYPVILLSLENITASSYDQFIDQVGGLISDIFNQFTYLEGISEEIADVETFYSDHDTATINLEADYKDETDYQNDADTKKKSDEVKVRQASPTSETAWNKFRKILERRATSNELISSLHLLSKLLQKRFHRKVYVLIDDYDCILKTFFSNNVSEEDQQSISKFYTSLLLNSLHYNQYLERSLITGTYDAKSLLDGFKTTLFNTSISILCNPCGFTRYDIDRMFRLYPIDVEANRKSRQWYNGYRTGRKLSIGLHEIEPFVTVFNAGNFTLHNISNIMDNYVRKSIQVKRFRGILANSITGKSYLKNVLRKDEADILKLKNIPLAPDTEIDDETRQLYLTLLHASGYFTIRRNGSNTIIQIPNHRIKYKLSEMVMDYYKTKYNIEQYLIDDVITETYNLLETNDPSDTIKFTKSLYQFFQSFSLYNDIFPLHLMKFIFHYFALRISSIYNYRLLEILVALKEPMTYFSLYNPERKVIFGIKLSNILTERMVVLLHTFENSTTLAPVANYTKIIALAIPRFGDYIIHHEVMKNS